MLKKHEKTKQYTITNNNLFYSSTIALIIFVLYISTQSWLFGLILSSNILQIGIIFIVLAILFFRPRNDKTFSFTFTSFDLLWTISIMFIVFAIYQDGILKNNDELFVYITGLIFLIISKLEIKRYIPAFNLFIVFSLIYAMISIFHYFFTDVYHSVTFPFIPIGTRQRMIELVNMNYFPGLGFAQPSMASAIIIVGIGLVISELSLKNSGSKKIQVIKIIVLMLGLILVGKRSILLWGILAVILAYFFAVGAKRRLGRIIKIFFLFLVSSFSLFLILNYFNDVSFFSRIIETIEGLKTGDDVTSGRTVLYERAWELFKENPIFGIGWGQFIIITSGELLSRDLVVHNVYLQLLAEVGLTGFMLIIIPFIYSYIKTFKVLRIIVNSNDFNENWKWGVAFSFYYQTFFLLYCLSENPFYNVVYMFIYFLSLSIISSFIVINLINRNNSQGLLSNKGGR